MRSIAVIDNARYKSQFTISSLNSSEQIPIYLEIIGLVEFATEIAFHFMCCNCIESTQQMMLMMTIMVMEEKERKNERTSHTKFEISIRKLLVHLKPSDNLFSTLFLRRCCCCCCCCHRLQIA